MFLFSKSYLPGTYNGFELSANGSIQKSFGGAVSQPSELQWMQFEALLIELEADRWKRKYVNQDILDGCAWEMEYLGETITVKSKGQNEYPTHFDRLIAGIESILGVQIDDY